MLAISHNLWRLRRQGRRQVQQSDLVPKGTWERDWDLIIGLDSCAGPPRLTVQSQDRTTRLLEQPENQILSVTAFRVT